MDAKTIAMAVLGVGVLAMLIVAFLSSKRWHWGHVTIVGFVFVFGILYMLLSAETLRIHGILRTKYNQEVAEQVRLAAENQLLQYGTVDQPGIVNLQSQLQMLLRVQGRVWERVAPLGELNPQDGTFIVQILPRAQAANLDEDAGEPVAEPPPAPDLASLTAGIEKGSVLFAFQRAPDAPNGNEPDRGPQYLGEFQVTDVTENRLTMTPVLWNSWDVQRTHHVQRLANALKSPIPWVLYETMPADSHDALRLAREGEPGGFPLEVLQQAIPSESLDEFVRNGEVIPASEDDVPRQAYNQAGEPLTDEQLRELQASGGEVIWRYERPLRNYELLFQSYAQRRVELLSEIGALQADIARLKAAEQTAEQRKNYRLEQITLLTEDARGFEREKEAASEHAAAIQQQLDLAESMLANSLQVNRQLAAELAKYQLSIAESLGVGNP